MTKTFADIIDGIRKAVLGVEVREDIAQGMEYVEQFAATATQKAEEAASSAERASQAKQETEDAKDTAVSAINTAKSEATAEIEAARKNAADNIDSGKSSALTAIDKAKETGLNALDEKQQAALDSVAEAVSTAQSAASTATEQATAAASSASAAKTSESNAKMSETESAKNLQGTKEYFEQVRTITIGAQGWYATPEALMAAVPIGENGWWAVVGTTDTIWTWDSDTGAWVNTQTKVDLSDYLTQTQIKALLAEYAYSKTEADTRFALTADKITAALGYDPGDKLKRLERMMNMDGKLVFSGAGVCTGGTTTMAIPSTVDYAEIVSAIPAMGRSGVGWTESTGYQASPSNAIGTASDFGHAKVVRGGSAAVPITSLTMMNNGSLADRGSPFAKIENASVALVSVSFAENGTLSISGGSSGSRFTVYGYQYL